ncbi:DUF6544 family protein [Lacibacter sp.]|uniref:DUF6544 family protein n=1 Tax=Lacibacter sp. TaxID=1915409 RepID=UPI002B4AB33D|nr:DUF6544 family protein [Lacibacter sp.]HLP38349.1 DUF6544 family protein [Lacibacter sp.]
MKYLFSFLLLIHGLIHLMGFANGFGFSKLPALTKYMSKPTGMLWLFAAMLFTAAAVYYLLKKENWALFAVAAVIISQVLIIWYWKDAKMGTAANLIILLVVIPALGEWQFNRMYKKEVQRMLSLQINKSVNTITNEQVQVLPSVVQKWLKASGVVDRPIIKQVYLQQRGEMKNKPDGKWIPFEAEQYFTIDPPSFSWKTTIRPSGFLFITGRDKYEQGKGNMLIKAYGLFTIADSKGLQTDQGTLLRYLAEICWFPGAALSEYIKWEPIDDKTAKATMSYGGITASGVFCFNANGDVVKFEADRYYINNNHSSLEKWQVTCIDHKTINGIRIPVKNNVTWKLKEGDFKWLELEITNIQFTFTA